VTGVLDKYVTAGFCRMPEPALVLISTELTCRPNVSLQTFQFIRRARDGRSKPDDLPAFTEKMIEARLPMPRFGATINRKH
jgi:hypothetical protein